MPRRDPREPSEASPSRAKDRAWSSEDTERFVAATVHRPPRPLLLEALGQLGDGPPGRLAIDLGCGSGTESLELLRRQWRVVATDAFPAAIESLRRRAGDAADLDALELDFESIALGGLPVQAGSASLVHAGFSLPFCARERFAGLWRQVRGFLGGGGVFAGQFFGSREPIVLAAPPGSATSHGEEEIRGMLEGFEIHRLEEVDRPGENAYGEAKHWHVFHVIARRR